MLEIVVSGLLIAAVSAIVFVAYRHPSAFVRLYTSLKFPFGAAGLVFFGWMLGDTQGRATVDGSLLQAIPNNDTARQAVRVVLQDTPPYGWMLLGLLALWAFLEALAALPRLGIVDAGAAVSVPPATDVAGSSVAASGAPSEPAGLPEDPQSRPVRAPLRS